MQGTTFVIGQYFSGSKAANDRSVQQPQYHAASDQLGGIQQTFGGQRASAEQVVSVHDLMFLNEQNFKLMTSEGGLQVGNAQISMSIAEGDAADFQEIKGRLTEWCLMKLPFDADSADPNPNNAVQKYQAIPRAAVAKMFDDGYNPSNLTEDTILQGKQVLDVLDPLTHVVVGSQEPIPTVPHKFQVQGAAQAAAQAAAQVVAQVVQVASRVAAPAL